MSTNTKIPSVVIIGAGMTGIMLAIKLRKQGITQVTIIEKKAMIGGTWRDNTYPGVACDVPSHMYCYSFAPNPNWSHLFAPGKEILDYFKHIFKGYDLEKYTHFNETVIQCIFKYDKWHITTSKKNNFTADFIFCSTGILHHPKFPDIPNKENFAGKSMHTSQWDHSISLSGKRIGIIGTGSSAVQLAPELIKLPHTQITVFQRTPAWMFGIKNKTYSEKKKHHIRSHPNQIKWINKALLYLFAKLTTALTKNTFIHQKIIQFLTYQSTAFIKKTIHNKQLQKKLIPNYKLGCKRIVINSTFYKALNDANVTLEDAAIESIASKGIHTQNGKFHPLDIIIYATGFHPLSYMRPMHLIGRNNVTIEEVWKKKIQAYHSLCIPQFPNFFLMLGPHSPIANYSMIDISEKQADWALQLIKAWQRNILHKVEVKPEAMEEWSTMLNEKKTNTVWVSGCQSWYLDKNNEPVTWPDSWTKWVKLMRTPNLKDFL
ncbi:NAD(P)/FAD-dependent oxidoreductase [uncultured Shewanella sp.]|uniref:flavin-containing monooxygenase n=1 Tax=uncultured Shewanella sp. TaxID=173975 RepID=UPI0026063DC4|nr:NAD(P)/FAD-dependent oxidoreductase [uncultured Shewanella sp.]